MLKRVRAVRDRVRHRRIARTNPLSRIPAVARMSPDVYHPIR